MRICNSCGEDKELTEYHKCSRSAGGYRSICKVCKSASRKVNYSKNRDRLLAVSRKWEEDNSEKRKQQGLRWREENRERLNLAKYEWKKNNRDKANAWERKREAAKKQTIPAWFDNKEVNYIYKLAKKKGLQVDHIVPLNSDKVCGLHVQDNLRCIPAMLNIKKSNKYWPDMWGAA